VNPVEREVHFMLAAENCALFLDFDGTLVDLAPHPDRVVVPPELKIALATLQKRLGGRLAVISGRPIAELDALLAPLVLPAAGVHGMEWRGADGVMHRQPPPPLDAVRAVASGLAARHPGLWVEEKHGALALHYRQAPALESLCRDALGEAVRAQPGLLLMAGKMIVEVKATGIDKGTAIRDFLTEAPFAGHLPLFAGDDTTDEAGFAYVQAIGGKGVKIGAGPSLAGHRLPSAAALRAALMRLAAAPAFRKETT